MRGIFSAILSLSLLVSTVQSEIRLDIQKEVLNICRNIAASGAETIPENLREKALRFYESIDNTAPPRKIYLDEKLICYEVPLKSKNNFIGVIYIRDTINSVPTVIEWPGWRIDEYGATFHNDKSWRLVYNKPVILSGNIFVLPKLDENNKPSFLSRVGMGSQHKPANRQFGNAVDPSTADFLIEDYKKIPYKNMQDRREWVETVNVTYDLNWSYSPGIRMVSERCISYAAAHIADWWKVKDLKPLRPYVNYLRGEKEYGTNPRVLELIYKKRASKNPEIYKRLFFPPDTVTGGPKDVSIEGYAKILSSQWDEYKLTDPVIVDFKYEIKNNPTGIKSYRTLFDTNAEASEDILIAALKSNGIILAGIIYRHYGLPFIKSIHTVAIIGYKNIGGKIYFIYRESFGKNSWDEQETSDGGPSYRMLPIEEFNEAYSFSSGD